MTDTKDDSSKDQVSLTSADSVTSADPVTSADSGLGSTVASHYNTLKEEGLEARKESRIIHMRSFNNWFKSILIGEFTDKIRNKRGRDVEINVLDLGSGKGGDQKKWKQARVKKVIHTDIAATSVEQSKDRYKENKGRENPRYPMFDAEFHALDCSKERIRDRLDDPDTQIDITSCQFVFHYSFETLQQADMMMRNACEMLRPGGYFIGTTPDARELVRRLKNSDTNSFGNDIYRVTFDSKTEFPLFGCKYDFHLEGVVDCPEFLVHFSMLEKLAEKYGMIPVYKENFSTLYEQKIKDNRHAGLLRKMNALEEYPPHEGRKLLFSNPDSYSHAEEKVRQLRESSNTTSDRHTPRVLTICREEWEAITCYLAFAFQKLGTPADDSDDTTISRPANQTTDKSPPANQTTDPASEPPIETSPVAESVPVKRRHSNHPDDDESESKTSRSMTPPTLVT